VISKSFLHSKACTELHQLGKRHDWWPFSTTGQLEAHLQSIPMSLRGDADFLIVGLNSENELVVQEIKSIADTETLTTDAFVVSYASLTERIIHDTAY
jgi:hypothetical protein